MPTKTEAIKRFLSAKTHADLANLYSYDMECQVNVAQDNGERVDSEFQGRRWHGWTDGISTWKSFRIPIKASTEPEYEDKEISYDLSAHVEAIGMTGWDWKNRVSKWVAFDFDALIGHSDKHAKKLSNEQLEKVRKNAEAIEWVTLRKSTSGTGLHIYVYLNDVPTANHHEHAALARSILGMMSALTGFDFHSKADVVGGNMWVWHRKMAGTDGLTIIKKGTSLTNIPPNWKDHIKVVTGRRRKNLPQVIEDRGYSDMFEELSGQRANVALDDEHKKLIDYLKANNAYWWWDQDHHMLITHTHWLQRAHEELSLNGFFKTNSEATNLNEQNCLSGDTEILTKQGVKLIKDCVDTLQELYVLTPYGMQWIKAPIKCFGKQQVRTVYFGDRSQVKCTNNHGWLYYNRNTGKIDLHERKYTFELQESHTELPLAIITLPGIDWEGYAHGFTFGDGWIESNGKTCSVALFKHDKDLRHIITRFGNIGHWKIKGVYEPIVRQLPNTWKELPDNDCTKEYALGFVLGLSAADGFVNSRIQIFQSNQTVLNKIRKLAIYAGLRAGTVRLCGKGSYANAKPCYALSIDAYNVPKDYIVRKDQQKKLIRTTHNKHRTITAIGDLLKEQDVYCAVVERYNNFTLANGVITSNCFLSPMRRGAWVVRRYTPGVQEHESWDQDGSGWTRCYLNREPDLYAASKAFGGLEDMKGGFKFREAEIAEKAAQLLGVNLDVGGPLRGRETRLSQHKDGRLVATVEHKDGDLGDNMKGWLIEKDRWVKIFQTQLATPSEPEAGNYDDLVRHLVTETNEDYGWMIKSDGTWRYEPLAHVRIALGSLGLKQGDINTILGSSVFRCWNVVNKPFQPEYPGDREWNRNAAQLRYLPTEDKEKLYYPSWLRILNHCGSALDDAIKANSWCKANGILTGGEYLKCWIASLFQEPLEPLPYLFLYGPQNSGKSIFHEALSLLFTKGYMRADAALINNSGFNGELEGAILGVVEETDLRRNRQAYNRIKDWVTSRELLIHCKGKTPYHVQNSLHFIQSANDHQACPVFTGDTRITMCYVDSLDPMDLIPKKLFIPMLEKEAPDFLADVMHLEIPASNDRLNVPVICTEDKQLAQQLNQTDLERFIDEKCVYAAGRWIKFGDFFQKFCEWVDPGELHKWSKIRIGRSLPPLYPKGRSPKDGQFYIGNVSWSGVAPTEEAAGSKYMIKDGYLVPVDTDNEH